MFEQEFNKIASEQNFNEEQKKAFIKGAEWMRKHIIEGNHFLSDDVLPEGSIVLERFNDGTPKVVLGPRENKFCKESSLWHYPTRNQFKRLYKKHPEKFKELERLIGTCDDGENRYGSTFFNTLAMYTDSGSFCQLINTPCAWRKIIDYSNEGKIYSSYEDSPYYEGK